MSSAQLLRLGLTGDHVDLRRRRGRLHSLHRGVFAVGHLAVTKEGRWMAAVLAGGADALLSHAAAAALWRLRERVPAIADVTVARTRRPRRGIQFHRARVPHDERTTLHGIPVTSMPRTILDLAAVLEARPLERAINEADYLRLTDALSLHDLIARYPRRRGTPRLRQALARRAAGATRTRSEMEELFLSLLERHGLPRPRINAHVQDIGEVDCTWPSVRLAIELDGRQAHATTQAFERDRERDRLLQAAGWRAIRVTWRQLTEDERRLTEDLERLLGATVSA